MKGTRPLRSWSAPASFMEETGQPFDVALAVTRAGNLFTTHTAVAAGFDRFAPALIEQYLGGYAETEARHRAPRFAGPGPPESGRLVGGFQHGVSGHPRQRGGKWREPLARGGQPAALSAAVSALAGGRGPDRTRDQRSPHADLGLGRRGRSLDGGLWKGPLAGDDGDPGAGHSPHLRRQALAISYRRQQVSGGVCSRTIVAADWPPGRAARGGRSARSTLRSQRADAGLCAPLCDLQAT